MAVIMRPCPGVPSGAICIPRILVLRKPTHALADSVPDQGRDVASRGFLRRIHSTKTFCKTNIGG